MEIERLNAMPENKGIVFAVNSFCDLTPEEFRATHSNADVMRLLRSRSYTQSVDFRPTKAQDQLPTNKDWYGEATTLVRDQGQCGSCWAFSTVEQVESDWYLSGKSGWNEPKQLSVQQVLDCDTSDGGYRYGCSGTYAGGGTGYMYITKNGGLGSEVAYPLHVRQDRESEQV